MTDVRQLPDTHGQGPAPPDGGEEMAIILAIQRAIRGPLNDLAATVRMLEGLDLDPRAKAVLEVAHESTNELGVLTGDLITLAAARHGGLETGPISFDLRVTLNRLTTDWGITHPCEMKLSVDSTVPSRVCGHPSHLRRALFAWGSDLSSPADPVPLQLRVERLAETETHVQLAFMIGRSDARPAESAGEENLELMLARFVATALQGEVERSSNGVTLRLTLAKDSVTAPASAVHESVLSNKHVLIVGPSGPSRVQLQMSLQRAGCRALTAATVEDAIRELSRQVVGRRPIDMCLVDFGGRTDDVERFAQALHMDPRLVDIPLVLVVELGSTGDAAWAGALGSAGYLTKPVQQDDLVAVLSAVVTRQMDTPLEGAPLVTHHSAHEANARRLECLVVDDDNVNLVAVKTMLERLGHHVTTAACGTEALDHTADRRFDLVLTDVKMPDMDGDQVAMFLSARQRERDETPTPMYAMTATPLPGDEELCLASGIARYYRKPMTPELLASIIDHVMERGGAGESAPAQSHASAHELITVSEEHPINWDHLEITCQGVPELRTQMVAAFLSQIAISREALAELIQSGGTDEIAALSEASASSCSSIGALAAARMLEQIEAHARKNSLDEARVKFAELQAELDRVETALRK